MFNQKEGCRCEAESPKISQESMAKIFARSRESFFGPPVQEYTDLRQALAELRAQYERVSGIMPKFTNAKVDKNSVVNYCLPLRLSDTTILMDSLNRSEESVADFMRSSSYIQDAGQPLLRPVQRAYLTETRPEDFYAANQIALSVMYADNRDTLSRVEFVVRENGYVTLSEFIDDGQGGVSFSRGESNFICLMPGGILKAVPDLTNGIQSLLIPSFIPES